MLIIIFLLHVRIFLNQISERKEDIAALVSVILKTLLKQCQTELSLGPILSLKVKLLLRQAAPNQAKARRKRLKKQETIMLVRAKLFLSQAATISAKTRIKKRNKKRKRDNSMLVSLIQVRLSAFCKSRKETLRN